MFELLNLRYSGRSFEATVVLRGAAGPLSYDCRVDGPATLEPHQISRALLRQACRRIKK